MVNKPLIRPYSWGGYVKGGGWLTSHEYSKGKKTSPKTKNRVLSLKDLFWYGNSWYNFGRNKGAFWGFVLSLLFGFLLWRRRRRRRRRPQQQQQQHQQQQQQQQTHAAPDPSHGIPYRSQIKASPIASWPSMSWYRECGDIQTALFRWGKKYVSFREGIYVNILLQSQQIIYPS